MPTISVVLIGAQHPGNIGAVCRSMKNFGFSKLVLVNPCELTEEAEIRAVHAKDILKKAKILKTFNPKAYDYIIGTTSIQTVKDDYFLRMNVEPRELRAKLDNTEGKIAILFGPEDIGLKNEVLEQCDIVTTITTSENYPSLNLSHAVAVLLYELSQIKKESAVRIASQKESTLIKDQLKQIVQKINYEPGKRKVFNTMWSKVMGRARITGREANTLIGVLKKINKKLGRRL